MRKFLIFGTGIALGYLLGTKAGQQRYDQIVATVRGLGERTGALEPATAPFAPPHHPETLGDLAAEAAAGVAAPTQ